jgi:uncharacterized protein YcnI
MKKRLAAAVLLAIGVLLLEAAPAFAHVTVDPSTATKGSFAKLTFRVPNEAPLANTVKLSVTFDENHPLATVTVKPKQGWTPNVSKKPLRAALQTEAGQVTEAVSQIVWSGGTISPGQFDEFEVSVGPLPSDIDVMLFRSVQTYSDGSEVSWSQQSFTDQPQPDHPAPELQLIAATSAKAKKASTSSSSTTKTVAVAAFVIGSAGLVIGGWAWWNVRRWR